MEHFICAVNERKKQFVRAVADTVRPADDAADGTVGSVLTEGSASSGRPYRTPPAVCDARPSTPPRSLRPALAFVHEAQPVQEAAECSPIVRSWDADGQQPDPLLVPSSLGWPGGPALRERSQLKIH